MQEYQAWKSGSFNKWPTWTKPSLASWKRLLPLQILELRATNYRNLESGLPTPKPLLIMMVSLLRSNIPYFYDFIDVKSNSVCYVPSSHPWLLVTLWIEWSSPCLALSSPAWFLVESCLWLPVWPHHLKRVLLLFLLPSVFSGIIVFSEEHCLLIMCLK